MAVTEAVCKGRIRWRTELDEAAIRANPPLICPFAFAKALPYFLDIQRLGISGLVPSEGLSNHRFGRRVVFRRAITSNSSTPHSTTDKKPQQQQASASRTRIQKTAICDRTHKDHDLALSAFNS